MALERTLSIIKPDATRRNLTGKINARFEEAGLRIVAQKRLQLTLEQAQGFYAVHRERPFYSELTRFMSSGACMILALEKDNAVAAWRETIGATNPEEADVGTIRKDFATSLGENAVHGSDSDENAEKEIAFFFTESELLSNK